MNRDLSQNAGAISPRLNPRVVGLEPSATVAINDLSNQLIHSGRDVVKLGLGQSPFPVPAIVQQALRDNAHQKDYLPVQGLRALREVVARHHRRTFRIESDTDDVLIGPGSKELMFLAQLVYEGELVIPSPCWVSYAPQARIIGRQIRQIHTSRATRYELTAAALREVGLQDPDQSRMVVLNYPSNPTGQTFREDQLRELASAAREFRMLVLSDEIYGKLDHDGDHQSIVPYYPQGTIFSGGLSKWCGAGGWRLGLFVFPKNLRWLLRAMASVASETFTSTSAPIQYAAVVAFEESEAIEEYLGQCRRILKGLDHYLVNRLRASQVEVFSGAGGFYLFPDFEHYRDRLAAIGVTTSPDLCRELLDRTNVAVLPGAAFGRDERELTARLAYVDFDGHQALTALGNGSDDSQVDQAFLKQHCPRIIDGCERICDWLESL